MSNSELLITQPSDLNLYCMDSGYGTLRVCRDIPRGCTIQPPGTKSGFILITSLGTTILRQNDLIKTIWKGFKHPADLQYDDQLDFQMIRPAQRMAADIDDFFYWVGYFIGKAIFKGVNNIVSTGKTITIYFNMLEFEIAESLINTLYITRKNITVTPKYVKVRIPYKGYGEELVQIYTTANKKHIFKGGIGYGNYTDAIYMASGLYESVLDIKLLRIIRNEKYFPILSQILTILGSMGFFMLFSKAKKHINALEFRECVQRTLLLKSKYMKYNIAGQFAIRRKQAVQRGCIYSVTPIKLNQSSIFLFSDEPILQQGFPVKRI